MLEILVIDDDDGTRDWFHKTLRVEGLGVTTASNGREGLRIALETRLDLIFADLRLPDLSGIDVLRELHRSKTRTPVVMMTAWGSVDTAVRAIKLGAIDYIEKPVGSNLAEITRSAIEAARWVNHVVAAESPSPVAVAEPRGQTDRRIRVTLDAIESRSHESDLGLFQIARVVGVTAAHLCRLLKRETGRGFGAHLHEIRIRRACALLRNSALSVKEIADRVGYDSTTQLDRHFRQSRHMPPLAYRNAMWRADDS